MSYPINPQLINDEQIKVDEENHVIEVKSFNIFIKNCESKMKENSFSYIDDFISMFPFSSSCRFEILTNKNAVEYCRTFTSLFYKKTNESIDNVYSLNKKEFSNWKLKINSFDPIRIIEFWYFPLIYYVTVGFQAVHELINCKVIDKFPKSETIIKEWQSPFVNEMLLNKISNLRLLYEGGDGVINSISIIDHLVFNLIHQNRSILLYEIINNMSYNNIKLLVGWNSLSADLMFDKVSENREKMLVMSKAITFRNKTDMNTLPNYVVNVELLKVFHSKSISVESKFEIKKFKPVNEYSCEMKINCLLNDIVLLRNRISYMSVQLNNILPTLNEINQVRVKNRSLFIKIRSLCSIIVKTIDPFQEQFDGDYYMSIMNDFTKWLQSIIENQEIKVVDLHKFMRFEIHYLKFDEEFEKITINDICSFKKNCFNTLISNHEITLYGIKYKSSLMARFIYYSIKLMIEPRFPKLEFCYDDYSICIEHEECLEEAIIYNLNLFLTETSKLDELFGEQSKKIKIMLKVFK